MYVKNKKDELIINGVQDPKYWSKCGQDVINNINERCYDVKNRILYFLSLLKIGIVMLQELQDLLYSTYNNFNIILW